ncbi:MAG TPA: transcription antitermination factor NusB, partial [Caulobacteraceae bacterium]
MTLSSDEPPESEPSGGLAAREAALSLAQAALDRRGGLEEAMEQAPFSRLEPRDRAFARMLAMTLLRRLGAIDARLQARLAKEPPQSVVMLLRLGVAQALYLDTPAFAAVDTTVRLAERSKTTRPFKGLVNGVLRGILRDPPREDDPESLVPGWLFARWRAAYGEVEARAVAAMVPFEPATDLTPRDPAEAAELAALLEAEVLPGPSLRVRQHGDVAGWSGYPEGRWWVQDAAAAIPARLLQATAGETVLDLCAAPGGKTLELAAAGAKVIALDRSGARLGRLRQALQRTGL